MASNPPPIDHLTTPLLSSRTLSSAAAASASGSRLPLRRPSISGLNGASLLSSTAPRLGGTLRSAGAAGPAAPATVSRIGTLKRTSTAAGLQQDSELSTLKRQLSRALHDLDEERHQSERAALDQTDSQHKLQTQLTEAHSRIDRLERHRAILLAKERDEAEGLRTQREEVDASRAAAQDEARQARERLSALEAKHAQLGEREREAAHRATQADIRAKAAEARAAGLEDALAAERTAVGERGAALTAEQAARRELEARLEELKLNAPAVEGGGNTDILRDELHRQVSHLRALEKENGRLTRKVDLLEKSQGNVEILREENLALEKRARAADELRRQLAHLEIELDSAAREKKEWQAFLGAGTSGQEFSSPHQLAKALAATRIESASYLERVDSLKLELGTRDRLVGELESMVRELEGVLDQAARDLDAARMREKAAEQSSNLLRTEVAMLKRHLDSYAAEESIHQQGNFDEQKSARLVELEQLLDAHKTEIGLLAQQVSHYRGLSEKYGGTTDEIEQKEREEKSGKVGESLKELLAKNAALEQDIAEFAQENESLNQDLAAVEAQLEELSMLRAQGHFDTAASKVLQLADNPGAWDQQLRESNLRMLKAENAALVDRVGVLEKRPLALAAGAGGASGSAGAGAGERLVPRESLERARAEVGQLQKAVADKEKIFGRLKDAFAARTEDVRTAVRLLLGYDISLQEGGSIRLISTYAPAKDRQLLFKPSLHPAGSMPFELMTALEDEGGVGGLGSGEVQLNAEVWIGQRRCLPGFLASLTLTLWEAKASKMQTAN